MICVLGSCKPAAVSYNDTIEVFSEFSELEQWIESHPGETLVVNFWATSCPPCIKEMPHFRELQEKYSDEDVKVLLVSLDKEEDLESRVYPFVTKYNITPEVTLLADQYYSAWTDKIDESWYGALPATIIFSGGEKHAFRFGAYSSIAEIEQDFATL